MGSGEGGLSPLFLCLLPSVAGRNALKTKSTLGTYTQSQTPYLVSKHPHHPI